MESPKYAIVDLETTGHSPANGDRIIQIAIVIMEDWKINKTFSTFMNPGKKIPHFIQNLTNITDDVVTDQQPFEAHAQEIYELLQDCVFVAHNADFDWSFLRAEFNRVGFTTWNIKKIDTVELVKVLFPSSISYTLGDIAQELQIPLHQAHRADDDAMATAMLFQKCWEQLLALPQLTLEQLHKRSFRLKSNVSTLLFDALQLKRQTVNDTTHHFFIRNFALRSGQPGDAVMDELVDYPYDELDKVKLMEQAFPHFEKRPQQFTMMDTIWQTLNKRQEVVIEASTGIGKTLSYLLPSVLYARKNKVKVLVSTYTSHLLEQLLIEEVPKLEKVIGSRVRVSLLKGMRHYIDLAKFEQLVKNDEESYDETLAILQIIVWLSQTTTGDLEELNLSGGGQNLIDKLRKTEEQYAPQKTVFDFYDKAIKQSQKADIIVTNHAMLLADLVRKNPLFQEIGGLIVDEAHQFVQAACQRNERKFSYTQWKYVFGKIGTLEDEQLLYDFQKQSSVNDRVSRKILSKLDTSYRQIIALFDETMNALAQQVQKYTINNTDVKKTIFLHEIDQSSLQFAAFSRMIWQWIQLAEQATQQFADELLPLQEVERLLLNKWRYWVRELTQKAIAWNDIFLNIDDNMITWIELDCRNAPSSLQIYQMPIDVTAVVQSFIAPLQEKMGIVWTSGTMTVPNNMYFVTRQLGIADDVPILSLQADAQYYTGARAYIVSDMPEIGQVSQSEYIEAVAQTIMRIVRTTGGRCFVLFTSQQMLTKTVRLIQDSELLSDYMLFAQGVTSGSRMKLLKSFQKFNQSILFGTNSFWEGVDVPGDGLSTVIIVRLPFSSPDDPLFKARSQRFIEQGQNSFTALSLPEAVMRFKQGFGRLIRSSTDSGAFIVLDRRIDTKSYGKEFIRALPTITIQKLSLPNVVLQLENCYNDKVE